jgi:hypothetical protein
MLAFRQSWDVPLRLRVALRGAMPRRAKR